LPTAPNRSMPQGEFSPAMDAFLAALVSFRDGLETNRPSFDQAIANAAQVALDLAAAQAASDAAAASAASAINAAAALGASTTSQTIVGSGSLTFTTQSGKNWQVGQFLLVASSASPGNWMVGQVTSYTGTSLQLAISASSGSGTLASWNISLASPPGAISGAL